MKVSTKLALGYGLLLALLGGLLAYHVSTVEANAAAGEKLSAITSRLLLSATDQRYWLDQMEESATKFSISGDTGYVRKFEDYADRFGSALDTFRNVALTPDEEEELARLSSTWQEFRRRTELSSGDVAALRLARPGMSAARSDTSAGSGALGPWFGRLRSRTEGLVDASRSAMEERVRVAHRRAQRAEMVAWFGVAAALLLSGAVWFLVVRTLARGLRSLTAATRQVAEGEFGHRMDVEGEDEFAQLARAFNGMTERLAELDELKRNFVSRISHDLKSPLASMQEAHTLLLDGLTGDLTDEQRRFLRLSRENGERLERMIAKLLELSRLEAEVPGSRFEDHELGELIRETARRLEPSFRKRDVELDLDLPADPVSATCDPEQVEHLLENLLENARRYAPSGSRVTVTLDLVAEDGGDVPSRRRGEMEPGTSEAVRLRVADAGPGIDDAEKNLVFDRFHHGDGSSDGGGAGLGLTVCREVARAHGGVIWVEDAASGGAAFNVLLSRTPAAAEEADTVTGEPDEAGEEPDGDVRAVG